MILIGIGANLPHDLHGPPRATCQAALKALEGPRIWRIRCSPWYETAPLPPSDQPWFVNAVAQLETDLGPAQLLGRLHEVEHSFGRVRGLANAARVVDLDLLAYHQVISAPGEWPLLPHPRLGERAFVLEPLATLAPEWRHPRSGLSAAEMIPDLLPDQAIRRLD